MRQLVPLHVRGSSTVVCRFATPKEQICYALLVKNQRWMCGGVAPAFYQDQCGWAYYRDKLILDCRRSGRLRSDDTGEPFLGLTYFAGTHQNDN